MSQAQAELALKEAEDKAWKALGRHDYHGFAKHAAEWTTAQRIGGFTGPSPFRVLVNQARAQLAVNKRKGENK